MMKPMRKSFLILPILLCCTALSALRFIPDSAFNPPVKDILQSSLLNLQQPDREDTISIYGKGLYHPFASISRFQDAFIDAFRTGKARHSIAGYQSADSLFKTEINVLAGYESTHIGTDYGFLYKGARVAASYRSRLQLNMLWWNGLFLGDQTEAQGSELIDSFSRISNGKISFDNLSGDLSYNAPNLTLALGRGKFPIGNAISGSIIMNDRVNDYGYLLAEGRAGAFSLSLMHASLMADSIYAIYYNSFLNNKNYPDKFAAVHQLSYHPRSNLNLFVGETIIYGNRGIDVNYLLPIAFWRATEHNLWDRDNVLIFGGGNYQPIEPLYLYAQLALDELSYGQLFSDWWGNKYALQGGFRISLPVMLPRSAKPFINMEITAVRPFTYTHYMSHTMFSHDKRSLGYPKGSNLVDVSALIQLPYKSIMLWQSGLSFTKQGSFGSDWHTNYNDVFPGESLHNGTAHWFEGDITKTTTVENSLLIDVFAHHRLLVSHKAEHLNNWDNTIYAAWQFSF
ncbi:MAG: hypothetical protein RBS43_11575 [Candidatus Cloacimonas sp.]|nr:hypothetical protein [Candidatus Cloacimonas sp.]